MNLITLLSYYCLFKNPENLSKPLRGCQSCLARGLLFLGNTFLFGNHIRMSKAQSLNKYKNGETRAENKSRSIWPSLHYFAHGKILAGTSNWNANMFELLPHACVLELLLVLTVTGNLLIISFHSSPPIIDQLYKKRPSNIQQNRWPLLNLFSEIMFCCVFEGNIHKNIKCNRWQHPQIGETLWSDPLWRLRGRSFDIW